MIKRPESEVAAEAAENLALHMTWVHARVPGMYARIEDSLVLADSGLATDTWNTICRARLISDVASHITEAIEYFSGRGRAFSWWLGPGDLPVDLSDALRKAGLVFAESEVAMAADLAELPAYPQAPAGLDVQRIRSLDQLNDFASINAANWDPPDADVLTFHRLASAALLSNDCPLWLYLGYLGQEPVATAQIAVSGGTAGLYNVSTRAEYRRRGIGMAMTILPLLDARAAGADLGILQAASDGVGVYRRAGFVPFGEYREFKPPHNMH
jgi:hypothetical protein